eukprot:PITA_32960
MTTRWCPTGEQIALLKAIYSEGIHRPKRQEIEQITCRLRMYGNIESKNVYYWFHNHTARKKHRQKRERVASLGQSDTPPSLAGPSLTDGNLSNTSLQNKMFNSLIFSYVSKLIIAIHLCYSDIFESSSPETCELQQRSAVVIPERQVVAHDNEPLTLELFPLHPTAIAEQKYEAFNTLGLERSVCNPNEQDDARSGRGHVHKFFHFISQHPGK